MFHGLGLARGVGIRGKWNDFYKSNGCDVLFGISKFKRWRGPAWLGEAKRSEAMRCDAEVSSHPSTLPTWDGRVS